MMGKKLISGVASASHRLAGCLAGMGCFRISRLGICGLGIVALLTVGQAARATVNVVSNPTFEGTDGAYENVSGTVPGRWRGFSVGGSAEVNVAPLPAGSLYANSPAGRAVKLRVSTFGTDQGFDDNNSRFRLYPSASYHLEFWIKTANSDNSSQGFVYSFPLFDANGQYLGRAPGSGAGVATSTWTKIVGPSFSDAAAMWAHVAFRVNNDGGENAILIALPDVQGPQDGFVLPTAEELAQRQTWTAADKLIGTSYFYWYRLPDRHFFDDAARTDDALTDHFPVASVVSMDSKDWHKQQVSDMIAAGIDMLWPVYWAAPGNYDDPGFSYFWQALAPLQTALDELAAEGKTPPKVGMFYDTTTLLNSVRGAYPSNGAADLTTQAGKDVFYGTIRGFFCNVKPKHWACINGRPIVVLYGAGFAAAYDQSAFDDVNTRFAADFGGITPYIIRERSWNVNTDSSYTWGAALNGPYIDGIAAVGAGYNDTAVPNRYTPIRMRENGNFYRWSWLQVLKSPARIVHLETWSEMHEGTDICASAEYGRQYIDLTAHYAAHFKAGTVPDESVVLQYPDPVIRPPNMQDGAEYADARAVQISAANGQMLAAGIDARDGGDGAISVTNAAGDTFLSTDAGYAVRYGYFSVKDPFYYDQHRRARVTLVYLDRGTATIQLQYDSFDASATFQGAYTNTPAFTLTNTDTLQTATIMLENARFTNRENGGSDFRYAVRDGPLYIKSLKVEVLDLPAPVLQVESLYPPPGARVAAAPGQIVVNFTADVAPDSVTPQTFQLAAPGANGVFGDSDDVIIAPRSIEVSAQQARLVLTGQVLTTGRYQVTLAGRGVAPIMGSSGRVLDGKFKGTLPSGDGTGGADFVTQFVISNLGDYDGDADVDQADFGHMQACLSGPAGGITAGCEDADLNADLHVNQLDILRFVSCMGKDGGPIPLACQ